MVHCSLHNLGIIILYVKLAGNVFCHKKKLVEFVYTCSESPGVATIDISPNYCFWEFGGFNNLKRI